MPDVDTCTTSAISESFAKSSVVRETFDQEEITQLTQLQVVTLVCFTINKEQSVSV